MRFQCPICKELLSVEDSDMGSTVQCVHCSKEVTVPSSRTAPGSVVGDFIILHELGRGGMGIVYAAHQISLDRPAAVKILAESYAKNADFVVGFIKEARAAAKLNHPNIVQAYAVGDDDGIFYFAMEFINGETMKSILTQKKVLPVDQAIDIVRQIAEALDYAWQEEKLVHRDIKPDNIMLTSNGRAKLADLGLAKVGNDTGKAEGEEVMGTPQYISPEQLTGDALDNRTDIYCLGATFYQFLTGRFPYEGASAVEIARQHLEGTLIPPNQVNPAIPAAVSDVVVKMMAKDPGQRYQSAGQLAEDLSLIKRGQKTSGPARPGLPKIHIPGKKPHVDVNQPAAAPAPGSAPKLSLAGKKPSPAVPSAPGPKKPPMPKLAPKKPQPVPVPVSPAQGETPAEPPAQDVSPVKKKKKKDSSGSPAKTVVKIIVLVVVLLVSAVGGWAAYLHFVKKQNPLNYFSNVIDNTKQAVKEAAAKPEPSAFMKAAVPVVELIRQDGADPKTAGRKCYEFLRMRFLPENEEEKELGHEILVYFAKNDESQLEDAREKAIEAYEAEQERKRLAAERAAREKMEADRLARIREAERKHAEEEREAERRKKEDERAQLQRKIDAFKYKISAMEQKMYQDLFNYGLKQDKEGLMQVFEKNIAIRETEPRPEWVSPADYGKAIGNLSYRARVLKKTMEDAWAWEKIFTDGDPVFEGMMIELNRNICRITGIKNGVLHAKAGSKKFDVPIKNLVNNKRFIRVACDAADRLNKKDTLAYYFFWMGAFRSASEIALEASSKGRWGYSAFVSNFLKEARKNPSIKSRLPKYFRGVPEYDKLDPPRKR